MQGEFTSVARWGIREAKERNQYQQNSMPEHPGLSF